MSIVHCVCLPFPPTTNNLFRHGWVDGKPRRFSSARAKSWGRTALQIIGYDRTLPKPIRTPVTIEIALTAPDRRRRDASNYIKAVEDALVKARVLTDDSHLVVRSITSRWEEPSRKDAGVKVTIRAA